MTMMHYKSVCTEGGIFKVAGQAFHGNPSLGA